MSEKTSRADVERTNCSTSLYNGPILLQLNRQPNGNLFSLMSCFAYYRRGFRPVAYVL